jgi:5-formyltetrahydrofolate cyclo-ligase
MPLEPESRDTADRLRRAKALMRAEVEQARRGLSPNFVATAAVRVFEALIASPEFAAAETIALYAAIRGEVCVRRVFDAAIAARKQCLLPRCRPERGLEFANVESWDQLESGAFGILEPPAELACLPLTSLDLALVPGVAFDTGGGRLGRGKGYYDRAFAECGADSCNLFGVAFSLQIVARVPVGSGDRRVDAILMETGLIRCDSEARDQ